MAVSTEGNMGLLLPVPGPGGTPGPTWAGDVNQNSVTIGSHDHSSGKGVPVTQAGINLTGDLSFNSYAASQLLCTQYNGSALDLTRLNSIQQGGNNLYWVNPGGAVQITSGQGLSATSLGGISGLPSGAASVNYAASTYSFYSATNIYAQMAHGRIYLEDDTHAPPSMYVVLRSPATGTPYALSLPGAAPTGTGALAFTGLVGSFVRLDGGQFQVSGNVLAIQSGAVVTGNLAQGAVTQPKCPTAASLFFSVTYGLGWSGNVKYWIDLNNVIHFTGVMTYGGGGGDTQLAFVLAPGMRPGDFKYFTLMDVTSAQGGRYQDTVVWAFQANPPPPSEFAGWFGAMGGVTVGSNLSMDGVCWAVEA